MFSHLKCSLLAFCLVLFSQAASAQVKETVYAHVRGWTVVTATEYGNFQGCGMSRGNGAFDIILGIDNAGNWNIGFPSSTREGGRVNVDMDIDRMSDVVTLQAKVGFAFGLTSPDWVGAIASGRHMSVLMEGRRHDISLNGTTAAIHKVEECASRYVRVASIGRSNRAAAPKAPQQRAVAPVERDVAKMGSGCPAYGSLRSPNVQDWGEVNFTNRTDRALNIAWLDYQGDNVDMGGILPGETLSLNSNAGHMFIAKDFSGSCIGGVWTLGLGQNQFDIYQ